MFHVLKELYLKFGVTNKKCWIVKDRNFLNLTINAFDNWMAHTWLLNTAIQ